MRVIMGVSADGFTAKSSHDDMSWTPLLDRQIFRAMTISCGGQIVMGRNTYETFLRPNPDNTCSDELHAATLRGRTKFVVTNQPNGASQFNYRDWTAGSLNDALQTVQNGWLIGGQNLVLSYLKLGVVTEVHLMYNDVKLGNGIRDYITPFLQVHDKDWNLVAKTTFRIDLCMHQWRKGP